MEMKWKCKQDIGNVTFGSLIRYEGHHYLYLNPAQWINIDGASLHCKTESPVGQHVDVLQLDLFDKAGGNNSFICLAQMFIGTRNIPPRSKT